jgi:hypothetical protein
MIFCYVILAWLVIAFLLRIPKYFILLSPARKSTQKENAVFNLTFFFFWLSPYIAWLVYGNFLLFYDSPSRCKDNDKSIGLYKNVLANLIVGYLVMLLWSAITIILIVVVYMLFKTKKHGFYETTKIGIW